MCVRYFEKNEHRVRKVEEGGGRGGAELFRWLLLAAPMIRLDNPSCRSLDVPSSHSVVVLFLVAAGY
jgi:hypothetical protein